MGCPWGSAHEFCWCHLYQGESFPGRGRGCLTELGCVHIFAHHSLLSSLIRKSRNPLHLTTSQNLLRPRCSCTFSNFVSDLALCGILSWPDLMSVFLSDSHVSLPFRRLGDIWNRNSHKLTDLCSVAEKRHFCAWVSCDTGWSHKGCFSDDSMNEGQKQ